MSVKVHINQHVIRANKINGANNPPVSIIRGSKVERAMEVSLVGPCKVVYSPDKPLKCGARVWIEAQDAQVIS